jgi:aldose 1-epimerase
MSRPSLLTLVAENGARACVTDLGATLVSLEVPDRTGALGHVVLGLASADAYLGAHPYFGSTVGRYANRIGGARFALDGREYRLAANDGANHLHGGRAGFHRRAFAVEGARASGAPVVEMHYASADGEEGYPGRLEVCVRYALAARGDATVLEVAFEATTDAPTVVNLANHAYFNLRDGGASDVLGHILHVPAERYLATDASGVPTGRSVSVAGTSLDFRTPRAIGLGICEALLAPRGGYDHCYLLDGARDGEGMRLAARVAESHAGRTLEVWTTQAALQLYAGNGLDGSLVGHGGARYGRHAGFCLETQHPPDAPNRPEFPSTRLGPGETYVQRTRLVFGTEG